MAQRRIDKLFVFFVLALLLAAQVQWAAPAGNAKGVMAPPPTLLADGDTSQVGG